MASDNPLMSSSSLRVFKNVIQVLNTIKSSKRVFYGKSIFLGSWRGHLRLARNCGRIWFPYFFYTFIYFNLSKLLALATGKCDHHWCRKKESKCCHKYIRGKNFKGAQLIVLRFNSWSQTLNDKYKILHCFLLRCLFVCVRAEKK